MELTKNQKLFKEFLQYVAEKQERINGKEWFNITDPIYSTRVLLEVANIIGMFNFEDPSSYRKEDIPDHVLYKRCMNLVENFGNMIVSSYYKHYKNGLVADPNKDVIKIIVERFPNMDKVNKKMHRDTKTHSSFICRVILSKLLQLAGSRGDVLELDINYETLCELFSVFNYEFKFDLIKVFKSIMDYDKDDSVNGPREQLIFKI